MAMASNQVVSSSHARQVDSAMTTAWVFSNDFAVNGANRKPPPAPPPITGPSPYIKATHKHPPAAAAAAAGTAHQHGGSKADHRHDSPNVRSSSSGGGHSSTPPRPPPAATVGSQDVPSRAAVDGSRNVAVLTTNRNSQVNLSAQQQQQQQAVGASKPNAQSTALAGGPLSQAAARPGAPQQPLGAGATASNAGPTSGTGQAGSAWTSETPVNNSVWVSPPQVPPVKVVVKKGTGRKGSVTTLVTPVDPSAPPPPPIPAAFQPRLQPPPPAQPAATGAEASTSSRQTASPLPANRGGSASTAAAGREAGGTGSIISNRGQGMIKSGVNAATGRLARTPTPFRTPRRDADAADAVATAADDSVVSRQRGGSVGGTGPGSASRGASAEPPSVPHLPKVTSSPSPLRPSPASVPLGTRATGNAAGSSTAAAGQAAAAGGGAPLPGRIQRMHSAPVGQGHKQSPMQQPPQYMQAASDRPVSSINSTATTVPLGTAMPVGAGADPSKRRPASADSRTPLLPSVAPPAPSTSSPVQHSSAASSGSAGGPLALSPSRTVGASPARSAAASAGGAPPSPARSGAASGRMSPIGAAAVAAAAANGGGPAGGTADSHHSGGGGGGAVPAAAVAAVETVLQQFQALRAGSAPVGAMNAFGPGAPGSTMPLGGLLGGGGSLAGGGGGVVVLARGRGGPPPATNSTSSLNATFRRRSISPGRTRPGGSTMIHSRLSTATAALATARLALEQQQQQQLYSSPESKAARGWAEAALAASAAMGWRSCVKRGQASMRRVTFGSDVVFYDADDGYW